jgi:nucleotide-binding universal stress UspA family protein
MGVIVVGVDGSEPSKGALRWAIEEAQLRQATVRAVHAWEPVVIGPAPGDIAAAPAPYDIVTVVEQIEEGARALVERTVVEVAGANPVVQVEPVASEGSPAQVLIDESAGAELVVVSSRGHGGFASLLLGSVSNQVAHHARCPVVIHRTGA